MQSLQQLQQGARQRWLPVATARGEAATELLGRPGGCGGLKLGMRTEWEKIFKNFSKILF